MIALTRGHIKSALASMRAAKWRSFLTMMGIIIGIVSVVTVVGIGEGVKQQVASQVDHLGDELITIRPGQVVSRDESGKVTGFNFIGGFGTIGSLRDTDIPIVRQTQGVELAVPLGAVPGSMMYEDRTYENAVILATSPELPEIIQQDVEFGGFFTEDDSNQNGAVIGVGVAQNIFGEDIPLGQAFTFNEQQFIVRGVFKEFPSSPLTFEADFNNSIFIPYQVAMDMTQNNVGIYEILVQPADGDPDGLIAERLRTNIQKAHGNQKDFTVLKQSDSLAATTTILNLLTGLIAGVAAISLLVGGIGIMNVMLVSVTERMHEIGVRKAIGATSRQIMSQFLIEATVLSVMGGVIGIIASIALSFMLRIFTDLQPVVRWEVVLIAACVSIVVGIIFGTAPAIKAARKDPIDALRHE